MQFFKMPPISDAASPIVIRFVTERVDFNGFFVIEIDWGKSSVILPLSRNCDEPLG